MLFSFFFFRPPPEDYLLIDILGKDLQRGGGVNGASICPQVARRKNENRRVGNGIGLEYAVLPIRGRTLPGT
jgi:hypothetical protein